MPFFQVFRFWKGFFEFLGNWHRVCRFQGVCLNDGSAKKVCRWLGSRLQTGRLNIKNCCIMLPVRRTSNSWLPEIFNDFFDNSWMERTNYTAPAINVIENEKEYELELAAPGLSKEDFKIQLDSEGNLVINMEKKTENKEKEGGKKGRFLRREFSYEKFHQSLVLPDDVDREKIEAKMENGVLNVHLPKIVKEPKTEEHRMIEVK